MVMPKSYDAMVDRKLREIRGNVSSVKMTEVECQAEIAAIQNGATPSPDDLPEAPLDTETLPSPKRKGGWPKGKKRGPRKLK